MNFLDRGRQPKRCYNLLFGQNFLEYLLHLKEIMKGVARVPGAYLGSANEMVPKEITRILLQ